MADSNDEARQQVQDSFNSMGMGGDLKKALEKNPLAEAIKRKFLASQPAEPSDSGSNN